jgi:hypothetical protein
VRPHEAHYLEKAIVAGLIILFFLLGIGIVNAKDPVPNPYDPALASGLIGISINGKAQTLVFLGKDGKRMIVPFKECKADDQCKALVKALIADHKADVLEYKDDDCEDTSKYLPGQFATIF